MRIITLPDGYNGHTAKFFAVPLVVEKHSVKLRCAEPGKEYMCKWAWKDEYLKALKEGL